jgi:phosphatidate cytidylyltransferase
MTEKWWGPDEERTPDLALPKEGITLQGGSGPELPHWTDPPTGDIPRLSPGGGEGEEDDLAAWQALGSRGLRWRDEASDWDDLDDVSTLGDDEPGLGALDTNRTEHSDIYSFDEQFEQLEEEHTGRRAAGRRGRGPLRRSPEAPRFVDQDAPLAPPEEGASPNGRYEPPIEEPLPPPPAAPWSSSSSSSSSPGSGDRNLTSAFVVGVGLLILAIIAFAIGPAAFVVLTTIVVTLCAIELYNLIQHRGFRPATLVGLVATVAGMLAAYWRGETALPLVLGLVFITTVLWYMLGVVEARPVVNVALTLMAFVWVGMLGSYAALLLRAHHGSTVLLLAILATVAADVMAYAAGRTLGSRPLAPHISPGKTWEGVIVGGIGAVVVSIIIGKGFMSSTFTIRHALMLGLVVAVVGPIGDLTESMVKRDLDLKDSGTLLPGHGGLLDRFDALLFVLPATFYLATYLNLLK